MKKNIFKHLALPFNKSKIVILALLMSTLMLLTIPPYNLYLLEFFMFIPGFYLFHPKNKGLKGRHFFLYGYVFSLVFLFGGFSFLLETIRIFGGFSHNVSFIVFTGYIAIVALKTGFLFYIPYLLRKHFNYPILVSFLVSCYFLESFFPEVLPYYFGNAQLHHTYFNQIADVVGVKGISLLVILINHVIYQYILTRQNRKILVLAIIFFVTYSYSILRFIQINSLTNVKKNYSSMRIGVVQPNMSFTNVPKEIDKENTKLIKMTQRLIDQSDKPFDLIVWPESSIQFVINQKPSLPYVKRTQEYIANLKVPLMYNAMTTRAEDTELKFYSDAILHVPNQKQQSFSKIKLLPFGEYMPLSDRFPQIREWIEEVGNLSKGSEVTNFIQADGTIITPQICYEITSPTFTQQFTKSGSSLIVNLTNDKWFGESLASELHLWAASFRALENRIPIVRATNSGITTVIGIKGTPVTPKSNILEAENLVYDVIILKGISSIYAYLGDIPVHLFMLYLFISAFFYKDSRLPFFLKWFKKKKVSKN